jgi:hypothetical protein
MDADRFNKFWGGVQSIVTSIAIVIAGVWAAYTFCSLHSRLAADLDVAQKRSSITNLEVQSAREATPQIGLSWHVTQLADHKNYAVSLIADIKNDGKLAMQISNYRIWLWRLSDKTGLPDDKVAPIKGSADLIDDTGTVESMPLRTLTGGESRDISLLAPPLPGGHYLVQFTVTYLELRDDDKPSNAFDANEQGVMDVANTDRPDEAIQATGRRMRH